MPTPTRYQPVLVDPFFDGDGNRSTAKSSGQPATPPGQYGYTDPSQEQLSSERSMTSVMSQAPKGLQGVVIPRSTPGGVPRGVNPHTLDQLEIAVDPHIHNQSSRITLGDLSRQVATATRQAAEITPEPVDIQTARLRAATTLHIAADGAKKHAAATTLSSVPQQSAQPTQTVATAPARTVSPLAAFGPRPVAAVGGQTVAKLVSSGLPAAQPAGPQPRTPTVRVAFEMEQFGRLEAAYDDVIVGEQTIILVFDTRCVGSTKYFPQARLDTPPAAINILGRSEVYLIRPLGIQFEYEDKEFCALLIEQSGQLPTE